MSETPAETIRRAAAQVRERAEAATSGPWWSDESDQCWRLHGVAFRIPPQLNADGSVLIPEQVMNSQILKAPKKNTPYAEYWPGPADDEHITSWHPLVALAVADWLDAEAVHYDELTQSPYGEAGAAFVAGDFGGDVDPALKVARAYLGEPS